MEERTAALEDWICSESTWYCAIDVPFLFFLTWFSPCGVGGRPTVRPRLVQPTATVDNMRFLNMSHVRTANVVKRRQPQQTAIWWQRALVTLVAVFCVFAVAALPMCAEADDASSPSPSTSSSSSSSSTADTSSDATLSADITDPNNLLGENVTSVTDMITKTKNEYGVSVRLLYLDSFGTKTKPTTWASTLLQSTSPSPNTVLLAVASADGNLVVAVSNNSDKWLKDQKSVDALSEAALGPLTAKKVPLTGRARPLR